MQLSDKPAQLPLPFAASGTRSVIPVASQIGIIAGAASLTDGFPPLTRTPIAAGGVPPSGADMNGILYEMSAVDRWANVGGGYPYDSAFATAISGYPKGARVLRTDGAGYWLNTTDGNATDPEAGGAGWRPDLMPGASPVTMTGSNVTLTALQYGQPVIIVTGLLTADLNLIFPALTGQWTVINATTGAYTITAKTAAGTGIVVSGAIALVGDGTNILSSVSATPDASSSVKGKVQLATPAEAQAGIDPGKAVTPEDLGATVPGIGQTRQSVTRVAGTTYTNTTGRQIVGEYRCMSPTLLLDATLTVDGIVADRAYLNSTAGDVMLSAPIGAGKTYVITLGAGASITAAHEIR